MLHCALCNFDIYAWKYLPPNGEMEDNAEESEGKMEIVWHRLDVVMVHKRNTHAHAHINVYRKRNRSNFGKMC